MKKYLYFFIGCLISISVSAKKVKFAVNMSNETVNTTGVHIYGDFQGAAGFLFDWDPGATVMTQETSDTNVYSVVVDIPAFRVYEYRFLNGDQSYEVEFVPEESRVNGAFDDNRWLYIDSTADDTTFLGVFPFSGNGPAGLSLVVFKVNMLNETVSPDGVHFGGNFQGWNPARAAMISFNDTIYRYQAWIPNGTYQYKFVNGNTSAEYEYVAGACAVSGNRQVVVSGDIALDAVNFGSCLVGISEPSAMEQVTMFPNPASDEVNIQFTGNHQHQVDVFDFAGRICRSEVCSAAHMKLENFEPGIYTLRVSSLDGNQNIRLVIQ